MGCRKCDSEVENIYKKLSETKGVPYFKFKNENGHQIIMDEPSIKILQDKGEIPTDAELIQL